MRVAQTIDSLHVGGAEKLLVTFAAVARPRDVRVVVISLRHDPGSPIPAELRALGADVATFPARSLLDLRRLGQVVRFLRRERVDVLHTHLTYANIVGVLAGRLAGIPVVATLHSAGLEPRHHALIHQFEAWALRIGARRVIAVGDAVAVAHRPRLGRTPITVIPNAVAAAPTLAPAERTALRARLVGDPARPLLISVGRLSALKGHFDLLDAFAALHATHPTAALAIVGDGPLRAELAAKIKGLELTGHAVLPGTRSDVPALLAASDLYVSSSHVEGLPVSVLEAMAAGLPVVATSVGDVPQVVVEGTGIVVPARDPAALAAALRTLLDDPGRMRVMGAAARAHVTCHYSPEAWGDRLLEVYVATIGPDHLEGRRPHVLSQWRAR